MVTLLSATSKKPMELARHCQNLEDELDVVKKEILKILSEKTKTAKENEELKKALMSPDNSSLTMAQESNNNNINSGGNNNNNGAAANNLSDHKQNLYETGQTGFEPKKLQDRYSPDGQEDVSATKPVSPFPAEAETEAEKVSVLREKELEGKCKELEESLELIQVEFEKMEDYWQVRRFPSPL